MGHLLLGVGVVTLTALTCIFINGLAPIWLANTLTGYTGQESSWLNVLNVHFSIWLAFFWGMLGVGQILRGIRSQRAVAGGGLLSSDPNLIYDREDRRRIYAEVAALPDGSVVRQMVQRTLAQYQVSKSWSHANDVLQATTSEIQQRADLSYTTVTYLTWLIPTLGFVGTVVGISQALELVGNVRPDDLTSAAFLPEVVRSLGLAFSTTLVALVLSAILIYFISVVRSEEDRFIADTFSDCVENLLNKLHEDKDA